MADFPDHSPLERIIQSINPRSRLLRAWRLTGGISAEMTAVEVERPDGQTQKMIIRRPGDAAIKENPSAARDEFKLLEILQSRGLAAPAPIVFDPSGKIFPTPYLVTTFIEGRLDFAPSNLDAYLGQFATHLARIHQVEGVNQDLSFLAQKENLCAELAKNQNMDVDPVFMTGRIRDILGAGALRPRRNAPVLLHGDYWPGNVLWKGDRLAAMIDWEDAAVGDPLMDLAISRLDIAYIFGLDAMHAFTTSYRSMTSIDDTDLPYWDLCAILRLARMAGRDLAGWAAFFQPYGRQDITEDSMRENCRVFIALALEQLGI